MIGGGGPRILGLAGAEADIVSLNFDNRQGKIGGAGVQSATAAATDERIAWIRAGAGPRFDDIELETAAYFTDVTHDGAAAAERYGGAFGLEASIIGLGVCAVAGLWFAWLAVRRGEVVRSWWGRRQSRAV